MTDVNPFDHVETIRAHDAEGPEMEAGVTGIDKQVFIDARKLIKAGWHQGYYSVTADNKKCLPHSLEAVKFCALGAIRRSISDEDPSYTIPYAGLIERVLCLEGRGVARWNDTPGRTQDEVLAAFDKVIATL